MVSIRLKQMLCDVYLNNNNKVLDVFTPQFEHLVCT